MPRHYSVLVFVGGVVVVFLTFIVGQAITGGVDLKDKISIWDVIIKAVAGLIALIGAPIAAMKYFSDQEAARTTALIEARKPFSTRQQQVYSDLLAATATVSTIENFDDPASVAAERQFWIIFWGALPMVTDEPVAVLADRFADLLAPRSTDWVALRNVSMDLSRACRSSLRFEAPLLPAKAAVTTRANARPGA